GRRSGGRAHVAQGKSRLTLEPRGSTDGGAANFHLYVPPFAGNASHRSTRSRTAPARDPDVVPEARRHIRDRRDPLHRSGADEQPLIGAVPVEQEPAAVRRPLRAAERAGTREDALGCSGVGSDPRIDPQEAASPALDGNLLDEGDATTVRGET